MRQTEKYGLKLVEGGDPLSWGPLNENFQALDGLLGLSDRELTALGLPVGTTTGAAILAAQRGKDLVVLKFEESATWTMPENVTNNEVRALLVGGGGGRASPPVNGCAGGGGGGYVNLCELTLVPGETCTITVGAAGDAGENGGFTRFQAPSLDGSRYGTGGKAGDGANGGRGGAGGGGVTYWSGTGSIPSHADTWALVTAGNGGQGQRYGGGGCGSAGDDHGGSGGDLGGDAGEAGVVDSAFPSFLVPEGITMPPAADAADAGAAASPAVGGGGGVNSRGGGARYGEVNMSSGYEGFKRYGAGGGGGGLFCDGSAGTIASSYYSGSGSSSTVLAAGGGGGGFGPYGRGGRAGVGGNSQYQDVASIPATAGVCILWFYVDWLNI